MLEIGAGDRVAEAHLEDGEPTRLVQVEHAEVVLERLVRSLVHVGQHEVEVELVVHLSE